jgi:hypothetical protein
MLMVKVTELLTSTVVALLVTEKLRVCPSARHPAAIRTAATNIRSRTRANIFMAEKQINSWRRVFLLPGGNATPQCGGGF